MKKMGSGMYIGHVINVHDSLNLDIDIILDKEDMNTCASVICDNYSYQDANDSEMKEGLAYRCRLKGLAHQVLKTKTQDTYKQRYVRTKKNYGAGKWSKDAHLTMIRLIDRFNGWILLKIHNIDVYNRLIVSLYDPITKEDLRGILVKKYPHSFVQYDEFPSKDPEPEPDNDGFITVVRK